VLLVRDRADGDPSKRIGFTVSRKVGNAVTRNRMKRRFRSLAQEIIPAHGYTGSDHVMIGRGGGIERDFSALRQDLQRALERIAP
jgi:ribonuclease P protein component